MKKAAFASLIISLTLCAALRSETAQPPQPRLQFNTGGEKTRLEMFSPDSRFFVSKSTGSIHLWDVESGRLLRSFRGKSIGDTNWVRFADKGHIMAYSSERPSDDPRSPLQYLIRIVDLDAERDIMDIPDIGDASQEPHSWHYGKCAVSADRRLVAASLEKKIIVFEAPEAKERFTLGGLFSGHKSDVQFLRFSPDGSLLASMSSDGALILWNMKTGKAVRELPAAGRYPVSLNFAAGGTFLHFADSADASFLRISDGAISKSLPAGSVIAEDENDGSFLSLTHWSAAVHLKDGIASASVSSGKSGSVAVPGLEKRLKPDTGGIPSHDLKIFAFLLADDSILFVDTKTGKDISTVKALNTGLTNLPFFTMSPDRTLIMMQEGTDQFTFRNAADGKVLFRTRLELEDSWDLWTTRYCRFLPDGTAFLRGKKTALLVDCREWKQIPLPIAEARKWDSAMFMPDGTLIDDWKDPAGRKLFDPYAQEIKVFSPDGKYFAQTQHYFSTLYLWEVGNNRLISKMDQWSESLRVSDLLFTPAGKQLLGCSTRLYKDEPSVFVVWNAATGKVIGRHTIPNKDRMYHDQLRPSRFSPDGKRVLLAFTPGLYSPIAETRVYDFATWKHLYTIDGAYPEYVSDNVILARKGNTFSFIDAADGKVLGAAGILADGYVVAASDGRYESDRDGLQYMHWVSGTDVIPLDTLDRTFQRKGLFAALMSNAPDIVEPAKKETKEADKPVNVSRQLVGKIESVQGANIVVRSSRAGELIAAGDRLFVMVDGKKLMIEAVFPMMTVAKCRAINAAQSREFRKGMPVFK